MTGWDETCDVVVVGSGLAGLSAAIEAARSGLSVMVMEKRRITGGNTRISDGGLAAPGNFLQKERGIEDSPRLLFDDMMQAGRGLNRPELVRIVAENATADIEWTRDLGVLYQDRLDRFGGHSKARCVTTASHSGRDLIKAQVAALDSLGVRIRTGCRLERLLRDDSGAVLGAEFQEGTKTKSLVRIRAGKALILATGGYAADVAFRSMLLPLLDERVETSNHRDATAEALIAALKIGAFPLHLSRLQLGPWGCVDERGYGQGCRLASYAVFPQGILVDPATGGRIVNEWADRKTRCEAMLAIGHPSVGILDAAGAKTDAESLALCLKAGKVTSFDSLGQLAEAFDMPAGSLEKTVDHYNALIDREEADRFGKPLGLKSPRMAQPPFYTIRLWPKSHYTPGGVAVDERTRVLDLKGRPIPGLLAAGEVTGGIHGASRLGACALTECLVFGRIAGRQAAGLA